MKKPKMFKVDSIELLKGILETDIDNFFDFAFNVKTNEWSFI
jgi:hypothetical protein